MTKDDEKLLNTSKRNFFRDELRRRKTRQGQFDAAMLHLGHPLPGGGRILEPSDNGAGAAAIRAFACGVVGSRVPRDRIRDSAEVRWFANADGWGQPSLPLWQRLWLRERKALKPKHRAVLDALLVDQRPRVAARIAGVSKNLVYKCLGKIFKVRFAQCYQALRADFGG